MELKMEIKNVKCIENLQFTFPLDSGIYAITGENGCGKSTLIACASTVFYQMPMYDYFGRPNDAMINFSIDSAVRGWEYTNNRWNKVNAGEPMKINGFYEGSIIFGNRFRDTSFSVIRVLDGLKKDNLETADRFVRENLGLILHNDSEHYKKLYVLNRRDKQVKSLSGNPYFIESNTGDLISQARMSTGENLLVSVL